jgi:hypothetical protein
MPTANIQTQMTKTSTPRESSGFTSRKPPASTLITPETMFHVRRPGTGAMTAAMTSTTPDATHHTPTSSVMIRRVCTGSRRQSSPTTRASPPVSPMRMRTPLSSQCAVSAVMIRRTPLTRIWIAIRTAQTTRVSSGQTARIIPRPMQTRP